MGVLDGLKERLGFGPAWDEEYVNEEIEAAMPTADAQVGAAIGEVGVGPADSGRRYSYESPYASGAAPSAVTKHVRKPDLERASAAIGGAALREVPTSVKTDMRAQAADTGAFRARPESFDDMSIVADRYKAGTPIVLDLTATDPAERQRFIDFAAGLVYGRDGSFSRNAHNSFLLIPHAPRKASPAAVPNDE